MSKLLVFIDYANIKYDQQAFADMLKIICTSSMQKGIITDQINDIHIRIYGGWNYNGCTTDERDEAFKFLTNIVDSFYSFENKVFRVYKELADYLIFDEKKEIKLGNTLVIRTANSINIRIAANFSCDSQECQIRKTKKWVKSKKACSSPGCQNYYKEAFETKEQKQIDAMIITDILHVANNCKEYSILAIISSDLDFSPAMFYASTICKDMQFIVVKNSKIVFYWENKINIGNLQVFNYQL